jgi:hypothetical protein
MLSSTGPNKGYQTAIFLNFIFVNSVTITGGRRIVNQNAVTEGQVFRVQK